MEKFKAIYDKIEWLGTRTIDENLEPHATFNDFCLQHNLALLLNLRLYSRTNAISVQLIRYPNMRDGQAGELLLAPSINLVTSVYEDKELLLNDMTAYLHPPKIIEKEEIKGWIE